MAYQIVSNISLPGFELTYGSNTIGLLKAWNDKRLYIGPSATSSTSSSSSVSYPRAPPCGNCSGRGCMQCQKGGKTRCMNCQKGGKTGCMNCQKGGKSRRRRVSTRRSRNN